MQVSRWVEKNVKIEPRLSYLHREFGATSLHVPHTLITRLMATLYPKVPRRGVAQRIR
jgi:hypothetical protein